MSSPNVALPSICPSTANAAADTFLRRLYAVTGDDTLGYIVAPIETFAFDQREMMRNARDQGAVDRRRDLLLADEVIADDQIVQMGGKKTHDCILCRVDDGSALLLKEVLRMTETPVSVLNALIKFQ